MTFPHRSGYFAWLVVTLVAFAITPATTAAIAPGELAAPETRLAGNTLYFTVKESVAGHIYQLQYSDSMEAGTWRNIESLRSGNGGDLVIATLFPSVVTRRFFRLMLTDGIPTGTFGDSWGDIIGTLADQVDISQALAGSAGGCATWATPTWPPTLFR
jgi:hypothetical protein